MYVWIGCALPEDFARDVRRICLAHNRQIGLDESAFALPQHISLKISFDAGDRLDEIVDFLSRLLEKEKPFYVNLQAAEQAETILWITAAENTRLKELHDKLDFSLEQSFGIPLHPFDRRFIFHSTLFLDPDTGKLRRMLARLENVIPGSPLYIDTFLLGLSPDGSPGSYRVVREIKV